MPTLIEKWHLASVAQQIEALRRQIKALDRGGRIYSEEKDVTAESRDTLKATIAELEWVLQQYPNV